MTVGIDDGNFYLIDNFPGEANAGNNPADWTDENVADVFGVGTKRMVYDDTNNGNSILIWLQFQKGTAAVAGVKSPCGLFTAGVATAGHWYEVSNTSDECMLTGPIAIALGTMTDAYYGWFWCGGVCPVGLVSGLDGTFPTDGSVAAVSGMKMVAASSLNTFELWTGSEVGVLSAISLVADANQA